MTDEQIIKALEHCVNERSCTGCIALSPRGCQGIDEGTLDIINRQKAEIESKNKQIDELVSFQRFCESEAIKEFAERLCEGRVSNDPVVIAVKAELKMTEQKGR